MTGMRYLPLILIMAALLAGHYAAAWGNEKWQGIDTTVVEKFAKEHGREARGSLIPTDQGDLLLFLFLLAGAAGGFVAGYHWRSLMGRTRKGGNKK
ncbi:MAG TPA: hypothetical protein VGJ94_09880 [Syntrophorhabdaceae bacterium]|jgi:cobalt/nickel transport system permease protein